ncbi:MAG: glycosyltransferase [Solirubrobacteraceae bacterium]|nr:glycosyltransferase [Patulibacter sp.]
MIRIVIPAFNEEANLDRLFADLAPRANALGARVIVVDDGSADATYEKLRSWEGKLDLRIVKHPRNLGLGTAINSGLRAALGESRDNDAIITMEADCTSDLDDLPRMLDLFDQGFDIVLASVYAPGGKIIGVAAHRLVMSRAVSGIFRRAGGLKDIYTLSSLYRVYRAGTLRRAAETYGYLLVREPGFAASVELLLKLHNAGATIAEIPTINDWTKREGVSKLKLRPTVEAYGRLMAAHLIGRIQPPPISPLAEEGGFHPGAPPEVRYGRRAGDLQVANLDGPTLFEAEELAAPTGDAPASQHGGGAAA